MLSLLILTACKTATPTVVTPTPPTDVVCEEVELDACADTAGCAPMNARRVGELGGEPPCFDLDTPTTVQGCADDDLICPAVEAVASNADGEVYLFSSGCIPAGWTAEAFDVQECAACADVPLDQCAASGCMVIEGRPLVGTAMSGGECIEPSVPTEQLACAEDLDCDSAITYATEGLDGHVFEFSNGCIPEGWTAVSGPFPDCTCEDLGVDQCRTDCVLIEGRPLSTDVNGTCLDFAEPLQPLACSTDTGCGDLETYAVDPVSSESWWFSSTCTPTGWDLDHEQAYPACL